MTERGRRHLARDATNFRVGPSGLSWDGRALVIDLDEVTVPIPSRLRGRIRVEPEVTPNRGFVIDAAGRHHWRPLAPRSRVSVDFERPSLAWAGPGYWDMNEGSEPLEAGFRSWHWARAADGRGAVVLYDTVRRDGSEGSLTMRIGGDGCVRPIEAPPLSRLPSGRIWRTGRAVRADAGTAPRVAETLEDTPFYARSVVETTVAGRRLTAMHESLDLDRFVNPVVQWMLPFRMPRRR